jgi:molybdopterin-guanine dinucleotide biosynthesis protein A
LRRDGILGVILAGGQSRRFGADKAMTHLGPLRLIEHVMARAKPQVGTVAVSGRDYDLGVPVIADAMASEGPLSGVLSALTWAGSNSYAAIATFSCDAPFFPEDLVARLAEQLHPGKACSYAESGGARHPAFALWRVEAAEALAGLYRGGMRALRGAQDRLDGTPVAFPPGPAPDGDMFFNVNRPDDRLVAARWLAAGAPGGPGERSPGAAPSAALTALR